MTDVGMDELDKMMAELAAGALLARIVPQDFSAWTLAGMLKPVRGL